MITVKEVSRQSAIAHQTEKARLKELEAQYPQSLLLIRDVEARAAIAKLKGLPVEDQIKGILGLPSWAIVMDIKCQEINAVLEYLGSDKRMGFEHGMQSNNMMVSSSPSGYLWFIEGHDLRNYSNVNSFSPPNTGAECIAYLLSL